jgi:hypothetical protein
MDSGGLIGNRAVYQIHEAGREWYDTEDLLRRLA